MIEVPAAQELILAHAQAGGVDHEPHGPLLLGRTLGETIAATADSPAFDKALMDGYALCGPGPVFAILPGDIPAGASSNVPLSPGQARRVFTGAPVPSKSTCVVKQEDCTASGAELCVGAVPPDGKNIAPRGSDYRAGVPLLSAARHVTPAVLGQLAMLGVAVVPVIRRPSAAVLATGSELVDLAIQPTGSQIRNSNGPMLDALVQSCGATAVNLGIAKDDKAALRERIRLGLHHDVLVLSGGVSVGDYDYTPEVLRDLGVTIHSHQVRMKPGKPMLFGTLGRTLVFGLPGNPMSAFVCFHLFVKPALQKMSGQSPITAPVEVSLTIDCHSHHDRPTYAPAVLSPQGVTPLPWVGSASLLPLLEANALLLLPCGACRLRAGQLVPVLPL